MSNEPQPVAPTEEGSASPDAVVPEEAAAPQLVVPVPEIGAMQRLRGRVLHVRPIPNAAFAVTVGPGPVVYWFQTGGTPPRLGARVEVEGLVASHAARKDGAGWLVVLNEAGWRPAPDGGPARRVVAPEWLHAVQNLLRRPLFDYQGLGAAWLASQFAQGRGAILADEPGVGKTAQTVAAMLATRMFPAIVVCPASLKRNWLREIGWARVPPTVSVLDGRKGVLLPADVVIVNYDILAGRELQLGRLGARLLILDEAHVLKATRPSLRHRAAVATRLAHHIGLAVAQTGTPILNRVHELWRLLHIVAPKDWPSYEDYLERYCLPIPEDERAVVHVDPRRIVTNVGRAERVDELQARVQVSMLRRLRAEVLDLPPKTRQSVSVQLPPKFREKHYDAAERDFLAWLRQQGCQVATSGEVLRNQTLIKLGVLRRLAALGKLQHAIPNYLRTWFRRSREPLLIFGYHIDVLDGVREECARQRLRIATLRGDDDTEARDVAVRLFCEGDADVMVAPIASAGVGLNLHERCANALFVERVWTPFLLIQAEDRLHRLGQTRPVHIAYMDAERTVDDHLAAVLDAKHALIRQVVDDQSREDEEGFAIAAAIVERMAVA